MPLPSAILRTVYTLLVFLSLFSSNSASFASKNEDMAQYQNKLEKLHSSIAKTQQYLKGNKKQRGHVITQLKTLESQISNNTQKLNQLEHELALTQKRKQQTEHELRQLDGQVDRQRALLSEQMRSAYSMGHQQNLKMLLNQQDPTQVGRTQAYFRYFNRARTKQITQFIKSIDSKKRKESTLKQTINTRNDLLKRQKSKSRELLKQRIQRKTLLTELSNKIKNQENTLSSLKVSRDRIENLLKSLGELLADIPSNPSENKPFKSLKGNLPWPVTGQFLGKFGQSKNYGDLKWNGVLIKSNYGTPIQAISHGHVVFSDWLQGFGFITIIDHGDGYMSLYGNSESLFKQTGDWVSAGEIIASAGNSGGQLHSGVYFEIRSRGKPVNPAKWCSSNARHTTSTHN